MNELQERTWINMSEIDKYDIQDLEEYLNRGGTVHIESKDCSCSRCFDFAEMMTDMEMGN